MYSAAALTVVTLIVLLARHRTRARRHVMTHALYAGERITLLTRIGKKRVIAPVMDPTLGRRVEWMDVFDTLHFTREVPASTQLNAARRAAPANLAAAMNATSEV